MFDHGDQHWFLNVQESAKAALTHVHSIPSLHDSWYHLWGIAMLSLFFLWSSHSHRVDAKTIIFCWMMASMTMNLVNREVAHRFEAISFPVIMQMLFATALFLSVERKRLTCGRLVDLARWSVVPVFFTGMLYTSIYSLREMSLSGVLILRNVLPLFTLFVEKLCFDKPKEVTSTMFMSIILAALGTAMYGFWNVTVTRSGILWVMANCVLTVADRVLQRHFLQDPAFTVSLPLCMVWNNFVGTFLILGLSFANGELFMWHQMAREASATSLCLLSLSCICGCSLGYLGLRCQQLVSATTFMMLQNFAKVFLIIIGMSCFGDSVRGLSAFGCTLSMCGSIWYSYDRLPAETDGAQAICDNVKGQTANSDKQAKV